MGELSMEKLHFQAKSTANLVKLGCTILFQKGNKVDDLGTVWHEYFNGDTGDRLFQRFMEEAFPNGCVIGEKELMQITNKAISFLETDVSALEAKAAIDKRRFAYWVYFAPTHTVSGCWFAEHEETVIQILTNYFGKSIEDFAPDALTNEEIACIRWHMGAFDDRNNWEYYTRAVAKFPNVMYTHAADMAAAYIVGV